MSPATALYRRPTTGAMRIDPLTGTRPTWRAGESPIFDELVAELGDPYLEAPAPSAQDDEDDEAEGLGHLVETLRAVDLGDQAERLARTLGTPRTTEIPGSIR